ncbi:MAG: dTMP kinase [Spirochaetia bacterium]|nr:dTMP kinase [Spirochaetia bacterium]
MKHKFIVIEGIDGAGKSTLTGKLSGLYKNSCEVFAEPTRISPFSRAIRDILNGKNKEDARELLMLFKKDRIWNIKNNIQPSINKNKLTVLDRYYFSTAAYQGQNQQQVRDIINEYLDDEEILQPDYVFYLKLTAEEALKRISQRGEAKAIFENKPRLVSIMQNYDYIFSNMEFDFPCFILDARYPSEDIADFIVSTVFPEQ